MKPFKFGFILGRFNHIHIGHQRLIDIGLDLCEDLLVLVGSSQEKGTLRNPFDALLRANAINRIYGNKVKVGLIPDLTHENDISHEWGRYVLYTVHYWATIHGLRDAQGDIKKPDLTVYGNDENRAGWYSPDDSKNLTQIIVPRAGIEISATALRQKITANKYYDWMKYVHPEVVSMYPQFRDALRNIPEYQEGFIQ